MNIKLLAITYLSGIFFLLVGMLEFFRLRARYGKIKLETAHKHPGLLHIAGVFAVVFFVVLVVCGKVRWIAWRMPLWLEFHSALIIWCTLTAIISLVFGLALAVVFAEGHRERWKLALVSVLTGVTLLAFQRSNHRLIHEELSDETTEDGVVLQTSGASCAAATGANILRWYGLDYTEKETAQIMGTTGSGTSPAQVIYGMRKIGFDGHKFEDLNCELSALPVPCMLFIDHKVTGPESHAVMFAGEREGLSEILDPLLGRRLVSRDEFIGFWHGRGIVIEPMVERERSVL